ncbi:hypothetical protein PUN28_018715 [Cardiocondyla obscurior]|uniref:Uncharacterized protein n=1 Tax=Cardiocondyla obscurior TaxID=286306 RepID=A0AAW2ECU9_9HYME
MSIQSINQKSIINNIDD